MATVSDIASFVRESMTTPMLLQDPVYDTLMNQQGIERITLMVMQSRGLGSSISANEIKVVIAEVKKEMYMRFATTTAPEYDLEERYTKITKSQRFDHYMKLWDIANKDVEKFDYYNPPEASSGMKVLGAYNGTKRNYDIANEFDVALTLDNVYQTKAELSWTRYADFLVPFCEYALFITKEKCLDPYANHEYGQLSPEVSAVNYFVFRDIDKTKFRVEYLSPATSYFATLRVTAENGKRMYADISFTTLA